MAALRQHPGRQTAKMKFKRSGILTKIIIIVLVAYSAITLLRLWNRIEDGKEQQDALEDLADALEMENADMQYVIDHKDDDAVKEQIARDELGLVKDGETVYTGG